MEENLLDAPFGLALAADTPSPLPSTERKCFDSKPLKESFDLYLREFRMNLKFHPFTPRVGYVCRWVLASFWLLSMPRLPEF